MPRTLLMLTTRTPRFVLLLVAFLLWTPAAYAWSWPVEGPVLRAFSYDPVHPYASGQHRGIDIGAGSVGATVVAPAAGTVSFAGTVPTSGKSVTIETPDGYSVTLTHLASVLVARGAIVAEQDPVGTVGPSGTAEVDGPYVHLGTRLTADPNGYVDPLGLLPPAATGGGTDGSPSTQPGSGSGSSTGSGGASGSGTDSTSTTTVPTATKTTNATEPVSSHAGNGHASRSRPRTRTRSRASSHERAHTEATRSVVRPVQATSDRAVPRGEEISRTVRPATTRRRVAEPAGTSRRPVVETAAPVERPGLDAGHEIHWGAPIAQLTAMRPGTLVVLLPLILNGAAALAALGAALIAARGRRRRRSSTGPLPAAQIVRLQRRQVDQQAVSRAA